MNIPFKHIPVLLEQTVQQWRGQWSTSLSTLRYVDCTIGGGGHTLSLLEKESRANILGLDRDPEAIMYSRNKFEKYISSRCTINHGSFGMLGHHVHKKSSPFPNELVHGILADIGVSSYQIDNPDRGFSYLHDGPLDMRMHSLSTNMNLLNTLGGGGANSSSSSSSSSTKTGTDPSANDPLQSLLVEPPPSASVTAADLVNLLPEAELVHILQDYGEISSSLVQLITRGIINYRKKGLKFTRTYELSKYITHILVNTNPELSLSQIHHLQSSAVSYPSSLIASHCSKLFQALRIAVNAELRQLNRLLAVAPRLLVPGGSLVIITFHSLEDRMVKNSFQSYKENGLDSTVNASAKLVPGDFLTSYNPVTNLIQSLPDHLYKKDELQRLTNLVSTASNTFSSPSTKSSKYKKFHNNTSSNSKTSGGIVSPAVALANIEKETLGLVKYEVGPIITPTEKEINENSRCRSATLRVLRRIQ